MTGIPLFLRQSGPTLGCWMRDSVLANNYYVTNDYYGRYVYEYSSSQNFESAQIDRTHDLRHHYYYGNSHAFIIDRYTIKELVKIPLQDLILLLVTLTHMREYKVLLTTTAIICIPEAVFTSILK